MKKAFLMLLMLLPLIADAQEQVHFVLMSNGTYQTEEGNDFVVIPFEGKTAHQIFQELASNVGSTFNNPSKVMSAVEDASIKIRAYSDFLWYNKIMGIPHRWGGYYQLEFRIKDNKVRVSAPYVEDVAMDTQPQKKYRYGNRISKWFNEGKVKEENEKIYNEIVNKMNEIINRILYTATKQDTEDW